MKCALLLLPLVLATSVVSAGEAIHSTPSHDVHAKEHHGHRHHAALYLGGTTNFQHSHTDFTLGGEYEFRLPMWQGLMGIGAFGEVVFAEHKEGLCGVPLYLHPIGGLKLFAGPGAQVKENKADFLFRVAAGYDFHVRTFAISPTVYTDIVEGHATLAYGVAFGLLF